MPKATNAEIESRTKEIEGYLLVGMTRQDIVPKCSHWGISERQICDYIAYALKNIQEINKHDLEQNRSLVLRNLWGLYKHASEIIKVTFTKKDGSTAEVEGMRSASEARQNLQQISKITGLEIEPAKQVERLADVSDAELDRLTEEMVTH